MWALVRTMWAASTVQDRQNLWLRFHGWARVNGMPLNADSASLFVLATGVKLQGQLAYTRALSATFGAMGLDSQPLRAVATALRSSGALVPCGQAIPVPKGPLLQWASTQAPDVRLACLLAWKTASRWGEVVALTSEQFLFVAEDEVVVDWFQTPKGRRKNPFRPSRFAVVRGPETALIARLYGTLVKPFDCLSRLSTNELSALWKQTDGMRAYTAHSIKRGAMSHLMELVSSGVQISSALIDRLMKHEEARTPEALSAMTLRYGGNPLAMARALRTGEVTKYL